MQISRDWRHHLERIGAIGGAASHRPLTGREVRDLRNARQAMYEYVRQFEPGVAVEWTQDNGKVFRGTVVCRRYSLVTVRYDGTENTGKFHCRVLRRAG